MVVSATLTVFPLITNEVSQNSSNVLAFISACSPSQWQCDFGQCLDRGKLCDGKVDCPDDNSDERDCGRNYFFVSSIKYFNSVPIMWINQA